MLSGGIFVQGVVGVVQYRIPFEVVYKFLFQPHRPLEFLVLRHDESASENRGSSQTRFRFVWTTKVM